MIRLRRTLALLTTVSLCLAAPGVLPAAAAGEGEEGPYFFQWKEGAAMPLGVLEEGEKAGIAPLPYGEYYTAESLADLQPYLDAGLVDFYAPDVQMELLDQGWTATNDPQAGKQWYLDSLHIADAWDAGFDGTGVKAAFIDSGINKTHEEFAGANIQGLNVLGDKADGEYIYKDAYDDTLGHGTLSAGILAAGADNGYGGAGLVSKANFLIYRFFSTSGSTRPEDGGSGYVSRSLIALEQAVEDGADVINMSYGVAEHKISDSLRAKMELAMQKAADSGAILIASAGNDGAKTMFYPAGYDCVIGVGSVDAAGKVSSSSEHNESVYVSAPGVSIYGPNNTTVSGYRYGSGTSFAGPMVSALAVMAKQADKAIDGEGFQKLLQQCAVDAGEAGYDTSYGYGVVDAGLLADALTQPQAIHYELNGGTVAGDAGTDYADAYTVRRDTEVVLPVPEKSEYIFAGWYDNAELDGASVGETVPRGTVGEVTYYAKWLDTAVERVTVQGCVARPGTEKDTYSVELPKGTDPAGLTAADFLVDCVAEGAEAAEFKTEDAGETWAFQVGERRYTLSVTVSGQHARPVVKQDMETQKGEAAPASYDEKTPALAYTANLSAWFDGNGGDGPLSFAMEHNGDGRAAVEGETFTYLPAASDAGKKVELSVTASDGPFESGAVTVALATGALPVSDSVVSPTSLAYNTKSGTGGTEVTLHLYGNEFLSVKLGDKTLAQGSDYTLSEDEGNPSLVGDDLVLTLTEAWLKSLSKGKHELSFRFSAGRSEESKSVSLVLTISDGSSSGGGGGGSTPAPEPTMELLTQGDAAVATPAYEVSKDGTAQVTLSRKDLAALKALESEKLTLDLSSAKEASAAALSKSDVKTLADVFRGGITLALPTGGVELDGAALSGILAGAKGSDITFRLTPAEHRPEAAGDRPVYEAGLTSGGTALTELEGAVALLLPYTLAQDEKAAYVGAAWVDGDGALVPLKASYDGKTKRVRAETSHFSAFAITYDAPWENPFRDVAEGDWYYGGVAYVCENGLFSGTGRETFTPDGAMTRAMLVTVLHRMAGEEQSARASGFSDVPADVWYSEAVSWAAARGLVSGYGDGRFGPEDSVTREQIADILYRYLSASEAPSTGALAAFPDGDAVSPWAKSGVAWAVEQGLLTGRSGGALDPSGMATRAEVAVILQRLREGQTL